MPSSHQTASALLTEHFCYTPLTLLDDIINVVNEITFRVVNAIEEGLAQPTPAQLGFKLDDETIATLPSKRARDDKLAELKTNEIDNGVVKLESLLNATVDKDFDKFEIYTLRNILAVGHEEDDLADWVRLDHYQGVDVASEENVSSTEELQLQRERLHETAKLNTRLKSEEVKNAAILSQLKSLVGSPSGHDEGNSEAPLAFLRASNNSTRAVDMTQDTRDVLNEIPALRKLLAQLTDSCSAMPSTRTVRQEDEDSTGARRRRYLEHQSRRALERKGIDSDSAASMSLSSGRKMGRDELEGLETVTRALTGTVRQSED